MSKNNQTTHRHAGSYTPWKPGMHPPKTPGLYVIEVIGCIGDDWSEWFNELRIECDETRGISLLQGTVKDQAELFSILMKIRNLGLTLVRLSSNTQHRPNVSLKFRKT